MQLLPQLSVKISKSTLQMFFLKADSVGELLQSKWLHDFRNIERISALLSHKQVILKNTCRYSGILNKNGGMQEVFDSIDFILSCQQLIQ